MKPIVTFQHNSKPMTGYIDAYIKGEYSLMAVVIVNEEPPQLVNISDLTVIGRTGENLPKGL